MCTNNDAVARAALSVGESLTLALVECGLIGRDQIIGALDDAAGVHRTAAAEGRDTEVSVFAAAMIERIIHSLEASADH